MAGRQWIKTERGGERGEVKVGGRRSQTARRARPESMMVGGSGIKRPGSVLGGFASPGLFSFIIY